MESKILSLAEREKLFQLVTDSQKEYLVNRVKRGKKTTFDNMMLTDKVHAIRSVDIDLLTNERNIEDWEIVDYVDFGFGNRAGKCACGIHLRYMFTVEHKLTEKRINYGKEHLSTFLNLNVKDIDDIMKDLRIIDYELDELLLKIKNNDYGYEILEMIPKQMEVSIDIEEHKENSIPLLKRQLHKLQKEINKIYKEEFREEREKAPRIDSSYIKYIREIIEQAQPEQNKLRLKEKNIVEASKQIFDAFNQNVANIAYFMVCSGINSALKISHLIRENANVDKRVSTGYLQRPAIYTEVVLSLMKEAEKGNLYFDKESSSVEDCYFYVTNEQLEASSLKNNIQDSLF